MLSGLSGVSCREVLSSVSRSKSRSATSYIEIRECAKPMRESLEECANVPVEGPGRASLAVGPKCAANYKFALAKH